MRKPRLRNGSAHGHLSWWVWAAASALCLFFTMSQKEKEHAREQWSEDEYIVVIEAAVNAYRDMRPLVMSDAAARKKEGLKHCHLCASRKKTVGYSIFTLMHQCLRNLRNWVQSEGLLRSARQRPQRLRCRSGTLHGWRTRREEASQMLFLCECGACE